MRTYLDFEKPMAELERKLEEMKTLAQGNNVNFSDAISLLENNITDLRKEIFENLTDILNVANKDASFNDFYKSIGILGLNGTVRNLGKGTKAAGNIHVKSGSIEGTRAYAGYVTSKSGSMLSFSIIAHKYLPGSTRVITDSLVKIMALMAEL